MRLPSLGSDSPASSPGEQALCWRAFGGDGLPTDTLGPALPSPPPTEDARCQLWLPGLGGWRGEPSSTALYTSGALYVGPAVQFWGAVRTGRPLDF